MFVYRVVDGALKGVLHGLMHVEYAFEYEQPLVLAEAATTTEYLDRIIENVVAYIGTTKTSPTLISCRSTHVSAPIQQSIMPSDQENMIPYMTEFSVNPRQMKRKLLN